MAKMDLEWTKTVEGSGTLTLVPGVTRQQVLEAIEARDVELVREGQGYHLTLMNGPTLGKVEGVDELASFEFDEPGEEEEEANPNLTLATLE